MRIKKVVSFLKCLVILVFVVHLETIVYLPVLHAEQVDGIFVTRDDHGINVTLSNRFELYFNGSNGGEVTRYFDLFADPSRSNNLVLPSTQAYQDPSLPYTMWPLFTTAFYNPYSPREEQDFATTGRDGNATVTIIDQGASYVVLQSASRIINSTGGAFEDVEGNAFYVNSTWLIRDDGYIFLERTLYTSTYQTMPSGYRWYPFYVIRTKGFDDEATFYLFNTTHASTNVVSERTYENKYTKYPVFPADQSGYFGVAVPFSNTSLGGDGTNNMVVVYDLSGLPDISEWRSDNYIGRYGIEFGAIHEFDVPYHFSTNMLRAMIVLTHQSVTEENVASFADYLNHVQVFPIIKRFGKANVGKALETSYARYKMVCRYLMEEDGIVTSISLWFGNVVREFEARVAIYTNTGDLIVQSQGKRITSTGWYNFTIPPTFLVSGFYGLAWKNSLDATVATDLGVSQQTARNPEPYGDFSNFFGEREYFNRAISIYATYQPTGMLRNVSVIRYPETPNYDEEVTIIAHAKDEGSGVSLFILSYSADEINFVNVTMTPTPDGLQIAKIPPQPYTKVYYKVYVYDKSGNFYAGSNVYSYVVVFPLDSRPPTISYFERVPASPNYNDTVSVFANVSEPLNASGVERVILSYWNGSAWTNVTMTLEDKLYTAMIPPLPYGTTVNYTVWAFDHAQNVATMDIYSYTVADRYPPTARIDEPTYGSYLKGLVPIKVTGNDTNFDKMELYISGNLVQRWGQQGSEIYHWDTTKYTDGVYIVKLTVYDKTGNIGEKEISVTIDNSVQPSMPDWTLALITLLALISAALIGTGVYLIRRRL